MEIVRRPPHPALARHVRNLAGWHERADGPVRRSELPGARIVLVVSFGPSMNINGRRYTSFTGGLHDMPALTEHAGLGHGIQAYLSPLGGGRLLGMPMGELTGQVVELEDLIGAEAHELAEQLAETPDWSRRFDIFERAIAARVLKAPPVSPDLEWAWQRLLRSGGAAPIGDLAAELGWSRRRLASAFRAQIGMTPKVLGRVLRFERAVERLRAGADLADIALDCGYYDQAHFNRDFREFAGATPTEFRAAA